MKKKINKASGQEAISVYFAEVYKYNMADWKEKSNNLAKNNLASVDETYPKNIRTPQEIVNTQLRWMKEKEFSNQIEEAITQIFQKRYTHVVANQESEGPDLNTIQVTSNLIKKLKTALRDNCKSRNDEEIATEIQSNRDSYQKLLIADNNECIVTTSDPSRHEKAVNKFLEDNQGSLDLALCGMILDHLRSMKETGKYKRAD